MGGLAGIQCVLTSLLAPAVALVGLGLRAEPSPSAK